MNLWQKCVIKSIIPLIIPNTNDLWEHVGLLKIYINPQPRFYADYKSWKETDFCRDGTTLEAIKNNGNIAYRRISDGSITVHRPIENYEDE